MCLLPEGPHMINDKIYHSLRPSAAAALPKQDDPGSLSGPRSVSPICVWATAIPLYFCMIGSNRLPGCCSLTASGITFLLLLSISTNSPMRASPFLKAPHSHGSTFPLDPSPFFARAWPCHREALRQTDNLPIIILVPRLSSRFFAKDTHRRSHCLIPPVLFCFIQM